MRFESKERVLSMITETNVNTTPENEQHIEENSLINNAKDKIEELEKVVTNYIEEQKVNENYPENETLIETPGMVNLITDGRRIATTYLGSGSCLIGILTAFITDIMQASQGDKDLGSFLKMHIDSLINRTEENTEETAE